MIIPIRCYSCGRVVANLQELYNKLCETYTEKEALTMLKLHRYCCRRMLLTHVEIIDDLLKHDYYDHKIPEIVK